MCELSTYSSILHGLPLLSGLLAELGDGDAGVLLLDALAVGVQPEEVGGLRPLGFIGILVLLLLALPLLLAALGTGSLFPALLSLATLLPLLVTKQVRLFLQEKKENLSCTLGHSRSQPGIFWTPEPPEITPQDTQIFRVIS